MYGFCSCRGVLELDLRGLIRVGVECLETRTLNTGLRFCGMEAWALGRSVMWCKKSSYGRHAASTSCSLPITIFHNLPLRRSPT